MNFLNCQDSKNDFVIFFLLCFSFLLPKFSNASSYTYPDLYVIENTCDLNNNMVDSNITWSGIIIIEGRLIVRTNVTILPGTVIKFKDGGVIFIEDDFFHPCWPDTIPGVLYANSTAADPIVFTSYKDDSYGGDTNMDGSSTSPALADWGRVVVLESGDAEFNHCIFKYGGQVRSYDPDNIVGSALGIYGDADVDNCHFEENGSQWHFYSQGTGFCIALGTNPNISNLTFGPNDYVGIGLTNSYTAALANDGSYVLPVYPGYPYIIDQKRTTIFETQIITLQPGTVIKLFEGNLNVEGTLKALGTAADPIIFTSLADDSYIGDTNRDGSTTTPTKGDWGRISVIDEGIGDFEHCIFIYGGRDVNNTSNPNGSALGIYGHGDIENCHFEDNGSQYSFYGSGIGIDVAWGATHSISNNTFGPDEKLGIGIMSGGKDGDYTLPKYNLPYIAQNSTSKIRKLQFITVQSGTVFKFDYSDVFVDGGLITNGTSSDRVVFTSLLDDSYLGDTNRDGSATSPSQVDWLCVKASGNVHYKNTDFFYSGCMDRPTHFTNSLFIDCQMGKIEQLGTEGLKLVDFEKSGKELFSRDVFTSADIVTFESEASVTLLPGFEAQLGSTFTVNTIDCVPEP